MESRKRKREASEPRVKYHIEQLGRSFERILKENSREELCEVVRKKLELDSKTNLELVQIREGVVYDLEDDDDFEAFKAAAYAYSSLDVRVSFPTAALPQNASNTRAGASPIPDFSAKSSGPQGGPQEKVAQKHVSIADHDNQNRSLVPGATPGVGQQSVELERSNPMLSSPREAIASPPKKKRKHVHIESDTMASESQKEREKHKRNESKADPTVVTVVPGDNEQQGPPRKKRKRDKDIGQEASSVPVDEAQTTATDAPDTTNKPKKSKSRKGDKEKGPGASSSLVNEARTVTAEVTDTAVTEVRKRKSRKGDKAKGSEAFGSLVQEAQTATASVADTEKRKSGEGEEAKGPQASTSVVYEAQAAAADRSDTANATNAKSKKSRSRKGDKEKGPGASESSMDGAQTTTAEPSYGTDTKLKTSKSKTLPSNAQDMHDVIMQGSPATGSKEQSIDIEAGSTIQKSSTKTSMSVKATSESAPPVVTRAEPPALSSGSHNPPANPSASTSDPVRLTYASFLNRPRRSASELLAMYTDAISKTASLSDPPEADHGIENAVASKNVMTAAEADKKKKNTGVDVSKDNKTEKPKPKLGKSHLSESWVPVDAEEPPLLLANKEPSTSGPSKALDAAPLPKPPEPVPRTDPTPKNPKTKNLLSTSKQASPCPICLSRPFHLRFKCPVIISGVDAMLDRIAQLQVEGGKEDLISELEEWVQKARRKSKGKELVRQEPEPNHGESSPQTIGQSEHRSSPLPSWAPVVSLQSHPSEVIVESTHEGSESASSASSDQDDAQSEASTDGSSSGPGSRSISPSPNLEQVDLNALIRGPSLTMDLSKLDDDIEELESESHTEDDSVEGDIELLEEEEYPLPKHSRRMDPLRSRSPEEIDGDEEEDSVSSVGEKAAIVGSNHQSSHEEETESSVSDTTGGDEVQQDPRTITDTVRAQVSIHPNPEPHVIRKERHATPAPIAVHQPSPPNPPAPTPASLRNGDITPAATSTDIVKEKDSDAPPVTLAETPSSPDTTSEGLPQAGRSSTPSRSRATTPVRSNTSPFKATLHTPGTIQRMKDKNGRLPLNPPDDEIGVIQPALQSTRNIVGVVPPKEKDNSEEAQPEPSRVASHPISAAKPSISRSNTSPSSVRSPSADNASSTSQPAVKRRGRPPLSEAVKAERKAMRDAQKAAKAADKRAKTELKKIDSRRPKAQGESTVSQEHVEQVSSPPPVVVTAATPVPMSQWTSLPSVATSASTNSLSSPAIDELMSSSVTQRKAGLDHVGASLRSSPTHVRLNGVRSPGSVSLASGSRKHDEEDVEKIVGSSESAAKRTPLFMPGASQMSQSQAMPRFVALSSEDTMRDGPDELGHSPSVSSSDGEGPSTKEATIPRGYRGPKSAFPSLSQLSFDKFKPSFLLTSVFSGSQGQGQRRQKRDAEAHHTSGEDDSEEEEEDESSGTEQESSHVPKDKRAGVNVPVGRKSRSRGLLH